IRSPKLGLNGAANGGGVCATAAVRMISTAAVNPTSSASTYLSMCALLELFLAPILVTIREPISIVDTSRFCNKAVIDPSFANAELCGHEPDVRWPLSGGSRLMGERKPKSSHARVTARAFSFSGRSERGFPRPRSQFCRADPDHVTFLFKH